MSTALPKISVIMPSYNQGRFIEESILSVVGQDYKNVELIIIDGGSTDITLDILKKYQPHIHYWVSEKDSGQSEAINKGLALATGDIATWLNSDDIYEPGAFETVVKEFLSDPSLSILHGKARLFGKNISEKTIGLEENIPLHHYFAFMRFPQPSSFYKRDAIAAAGGVNNHLHYAMDFELVVKCLLNGAGIKLTDTTLSRYRLHEHSKSNHELLFVKDWSAVTHRFFQSLDNGKPYSSAMVRLGLCQAQEGIYPSVIRFNDDELESVLLLHLDMCYHFSYRNDDYSQAKKISAYLAANYPAWFKQKAYRKYNRRMQLIPKFVFKIIRQLTA